MRRLPFPGWVLAVSSVAFVVTWVLAPRPTLSGMTLPRAIPPSPRSASGPTPVQQVRTLPTPDTALQEGPSPDPIRSPGRPYTVAFTFDDGPHPVYTPRLLDLLERYEVRATFFVNGYWMYGSSPRARANRALVRAAYRLGHSIGNHTFSHQNLGKLPPALQTEEILHNQRLIAQVTGAQPAPLFRPPYGTMTQHAVGVLRRHGYLQIRWDATAPDEVWDNAEAIRDEVMLWLRVHKGGIVMLHERFRWSVEATGMILASLQRMNCRRLSRHQPTFRLVPLESALRPPPVSWPEIQQEAAERRQHLRRLRTSCGVAQ
jgi:peptidoglycan/xylan/chitin deacetylase (PgdA/CDA1 family)